MAGRKPKLTPEVTDTICQYIRAGSYMVQAANAAGVAKRTVNIWLKHAEESREKNVVDRYTEFADAVELAIAEAEARDVAVISNAAMHDWKAAAWLLEKKYPKRWGSRREIELTGKDGAPVVPGVVILPPLKSDDNKINDSQAGEDPVGGESGSSD